ncbi:MAG: hypothetical protein GX944_01555 [Alphaproteobacteria bacterium]|nr:hypothetical protein [Alphaproteobacteria bacterium]
MRNAIILHGIAENRQDYTNHPKSPSNLSWFPVVQWEMIKRGILTQTPEMPNPYLPDMNYEEWVKIISRFEINEKTILIGHSCGGGFWLKYLSTNPQIKIDQLILIAPWIDIDHEHPTFFANWEMNKNLTTNCKQVDLFYSSDDMDIIIDSVSKIKSVYGGGKINYHEFTDKGHFCHDDIGCNFPELLKVIK